MLATSASRAIEREFTMTFTMIAELLVALLALVTAGFSLGALLKHNPLEDEMFQLRTENEALFQENFELKNNLKTDAH